MANSYIRVPPDSTGKLIDTSQLVNSSGDTVQLHRVNIADPATHGAIAPVTSSGGMGVTILAGAASGSTAVNILGSSGAIAPATSSGGLSVSIVAGAVGSTVVSLSSQITVNVSSGLISITSGTITLSSAIAISSGTVTATAATNPWSSAPSFNMPMVSASSGLVQISGTASVLSASSGQVGAFASTSRQYLSFVFNSSSSNSIAILTTAPAIFYGWNVGNQGTSASASIKIFNTSSGAVGSTAQLQVTIPIPGGSAGAGNNMMLPQGVSCTGGITMAITANFAATSTGPVAASDVVGTLYYNI